MSTMGQTYIAKATGIGAMNLWCGTYTKFGEEKSSDKVFYLRVFSSDVEYLIEILSCKGYSCVESTATQVAFDSTGKSFSSFLRDLNSIDIGGALCCVKHIQDPGVGLYGVDDHDELFALGFGVNCTCSYCAQDSPPCCCSECVPDDFFLDSP